MNIIKNKPLRIWLKLDSHLKWLCNIVEGWLKSRVILVWNVTYYILSTVLTLSYAKNPGKNSQTTKIFTVFFEGVNVRHPLTVIIKQEILPTIFEFSQPFFHENKTWDLKICQHLNVWNGI